ncbi:hypothetical protein MCOR27_001640 [Pyricularia oryzae]|uniref:NTF2-like protein n=5 Tax=Pyricularia TaxID=48558 RepID=A0ABQ8N5Z5_PYRGI|nr:uncharacterized protein MGG_11061 [Pyricularia oryzae 70-15]ELQ33254.1 hypothetical protein OOU_Y34scaffold00979g37 [Pyricularia oryzae Y34]KAH8837622.1 hypothetical protein MCOR01_011229 [Pyricularia oryzae]KAI6291826.1 hypothetical protein MCOR33_010321 [Pyricularia grisea]EHA53650.1 hypothetical protein MGG_11061 [Pyricularia oryzae 70-15]KAH9437692.1 hypothetical protein MCOR02_001345 [Pyricularia oryzae]
MALQAAYVQFLTAPNLAALAEKATLNYITTTTSISGAGEVVKHLNGLHSHVKKNKETLLSAIEGRDGLALAIEMDTSLEFVISGGPYLPGLDDNFLADRKIQVCITHIVAFDSDGKIVQIRQSWDQGSLLKQVDVIGRSGRNWPIRDSTEQIKLIAKCIKGEADASGGDLPIRSRATSTNAMRDPHASLNLFAPRAEQEEAEIGAVVSPYAGKSRPHQRSFTDILGDEPEESEDGSPGRPGSPTKGFAPKAGAGKHFQQPRLFETNEEDEPESPVHHKSPERQYKPNPKKYEHFEFADGSDPRDAPVRGTEFDKVNRGKHNSQWDFKDFVTPQKPRGRPQRSQDVRHWSTENDDAIIETPAARRPAPPKPRRDAETHFELQDDGPDGEPRPAGRPRGAGHNEGLGLYKNNLYNEDGSTPDGPDPRALGNITNVKDRRRDFDPHFGITDDSPNQGANQVENPRGVPEGRKKAVKMMESSWSAYDKSPVSQKENSQPDILGGRKGEDQGIAIGGDGMGGKKGSSRNYIFGDPDSEDEVPRLVTKKQGAAHKPTAGSFWDF